VWLNLNLVEGFHRTGWVSEEAERKGGLGQVLPALHALHFMPGFMVGGGARSQSHDPRVLNLAVTLVD